MVSTSTVYEPETTWIKIYISVLLPSKCLLPLYFVYFISKKKKLYFGPVIFSSVTDVLETILLFGYLCSLQSQPESISETLRFWNAHTGTLCYKHCNQIENIKHPQSQNCLSLCWLNYNTVFVREKKILQQSNLKFPHGKYDFQ